MRVLLINPGNGDFLRAEHLMRQYGQEHMAVERVRARYKSILYAWEPNHVAAVWHSGNQITIHFGSDPE